MLRKYFGLGALSVALVAVASAAQATVFMQDDFDYANGQLTSADATHLTGGTGANVSGGNWTATGAAGGTAEFLQVIDKKVDVLTSGTEDASRAAGATLTADGATWYYAARLNVIDKRPEGNTDIIGSNYFMHFKDEGTFNLVGRLYVAPATGAGTNFTFGLSSYSVNATGGAIQRWGTDLAFGAQNTYIVVVSLTTKDSDPGTTTDGNTSLWVNPLNQASTHITDTAPHSDYFLANTDPNTPGPDRDNMSRLSLRQTNAGNTQPEMLIDKVAIGDSFDEVLAAVTPVSNNSDFNNDGTVDGADFLIWQKGNGLTGQTDKTNGNANADTVVDSADLAIWTAKFGGAPSAAAATAAPEPAGAVLLAMGLAAAYRVRRRTS